MLSYALGKGFGVDKIMKMTRDFQSSLRIKPAAFGEKKNQAGPTPGKWEESKLPESSDVPMLVSTPSPKPLIQQETFHRDQYGRETGVEIEEAMPDDAYTPPSARLVRQGAFQLNV